MRLTVTMNLDRDEEGERAFFVVVAHQVTGDIALCLGVPHGLGLGDVEVHA